MMILLAVHSQASTRSCDVQLRQQQTVCSSHQALQLAFMAPCLLSAEHQGQRMTLWCRTPDARALHGSLTNVLAASIVALALHGYGT
jgi:hypothetical protein